MAVTWTVEERLAAKLILDWVTSLCREIKIRNIPLDRG